MDQTTPNILIIRGSLIKQMPSDFSFTDFSQSPWLNCGLCCVLLQTCFPKCLKIMPESAVMNIRLPSWIRKPSSDVEIYRFVPWLVIAGVRSGEEHINRHGHLLPRMVLKTKNTILQEKDQYSLKKWLPGQGKNIQDELSNFKVSCLITVATMRGAGVTVAWLTSSAGDQVPVSISTMVTGLSCDVGQTRACTSVRITEASSLTRGTLSGIHTRRMTGASWDKRR